MHILKHKNFPFGFMSYLLFAQYIFEYIFQLQYLKVLYKRGLSVVWKIPVLIGNRNDSDLFLKIDALKKLTKSLKNSCNQ